jgi:hypothetical protein
LEEVEQAIYVRDIVLSPDITVHADPDQLLVKVSEAIIKEEEVVVAAEVEEEVEGEAEVEGEVKAEAPAEGEAEKPPADS